MTGDRTASGEHDSDREADPSANATIHAYYDALRNGEPLSLYFVADPKTVKFGITERLTGYEEIAEGLHTQTETTTDWHVESHELVVGERGSHAWFGDDVSMSWTDATTGERHAYRTRWSGTLERIDGSGSGTGDEAGDGDDGRHAAGSERWRFVSMHVSRSGTF